MFSILLFASAAFGDLRDAAKTLEQTTSALTPSLRQSFRMSAAASLQRGFPDLSRRFVELTLAEARDTGELTDPAVRILAELAPADLVRVYSGLGAASRNVVLSEADPLLKRWIKDRPELALELYRAIVSHFPYESFTPGQAWTLLSCATTMSGVAPAPTTEAAGKLVQTASKDQFGSGIERNITYSFEAAGNATSTTDPREMVLQASRALLAKDGAKGGAAKLVITSARRNQTASAGRKSLVPKLRAASSDEERAKLANRRGKSDCTTAGRSRKKSRCAKPGQSRHRRRPWE